MGDGRGQARPWGRRGFTGRLIFFKIGVALDKRCQTYACPCINDNEEISVDRSQVEEIANETMRQWES